jgi:hypothetical protein
VRCPQCGNENPETHRFCGMCGASLLQGPGAAMAAPGNSIPAPPAPASAPVPRVAAPAATATAPRPAAPQPASPPAVPRAAAAEAAPSPPRATAAPAEPRPRSNEEEPVISGPSFLGLNQPAPSPTRRGSLSIDPNHAPSSRSLDYLLEDDEPKSGAGWKVLLVLIALVLAVGFGYLRWKNGDLPFLNPTSKPSAQSPAITEAPANSDASSNAPANPPGGSVTPASPATATTQNSNPATAPATSAPATGGGNQPASNGSAAANASPSNSGTDNSSNRSSAITPATPSGAVANPSAPAIQPARSDSSGSAPVNPTPQAQASTPKNSDDSDSPSSEDEAVDNDTTAASKAARKPAAAIERSDPVAEAQKYLYGKGAAQDCDRGLRLLKPSANSGNPKAMIEMGALYSAGLCTPHDLPTAYRWFAMALRKDPENQSVATDLQKLWGEMTQPERQLAIRLSQ